MPEPAVQAALFMRVRGPLSGHVPHLLTMDYPDLEAELVMGQYDLIAFVKGPSLEKVGSVVMRVKNTPLRVLHNETLEWKSVHSCHDYLVIPFHQGGDSSAQRKVPVSQSQEDEPATESAIRNPVEAFVVLYFAKEALARLDQASNVKRQRDRLWKALGKRLAPAILVAAYRIQNRARVILRVQAPTAGVLHDAIMLAFQHYRSATGDELADSDERISFDLMPMATETFHIVPVPQQLKKRNEDIRRLRLLSDALVNEKAGKTVAAKAWDCHEKSATSHLEHLEGLRWIERTSSTVATNQKISWRLTSRGRDLVGTPKQLGRMEKPLA